MGAPFWLRFGVGGLSQVSPDRAASLAFRFFRKPALTVGYTARELKHLEAAQRVLMRGRRQVTYGPSGRIVSYQFAPRKRCRGVVLLLHGWSGDSRAMAAFPEALTRAGYETVLIDLPAHGGSDGEETDLIEAADATSAFLEETALKPDHIIAHSFGGAVASLLAARGVIPRTLTSIAAPTSFALVLDEMGLVFGLSPRAKARFAARVEQTCGITTDNLDAVNFWRGKDTDILLLHAPEDTRVSFAHAEHLAILPNTVLKPISGLDHSGIIYAPASVTAALAHILKADAATFDHVEAVSEAA